MKEKNAQETGATRAKETENGKEVESQVMEDVAKVRLVSAQTVQDAKGQKKGVQYGKQKSRKGKGKGKPMGGKGISGKHGNRK